MPYPLVPLQKKTLILGITLACLHNVRSVLFLTADVDDSTTCGYSVESPCDMLCHIFHTCKFSTAEVVIDRTKAGEIFDAGGQKLHKFQHHFDWSLLILFTVYIYFRAQTFPHQTKHITCIQTHSVN